MAQGPTTSVSIRAAGESSLGLEDSRVVARGPTTSVSIRAAGESSLGLEDSRVVARGPTTANSTDAPTVESSSDLLAN